MNADFVTSSELASKLETVDAKPVDDAPAYLVVNKIIKQNGP